MEFQWKYAEPLLAKLDFPDYGSNDRWRFWYEEAWSHMSKAGIAQVQTPLDDTRVRLRILALCWLAHDFCGAAFSDPYCSCPYWSEWIKVADIDALWAVLTATDQELIHGVVTESGLMSTDNIEEQDGELLYYKEEIQQDVALKLVMAAVYTQRHEVAAALLDGFGGSSLLFASMYGNCGWIEKEIERRRDSLDEELDDLEEQLEDASCEETANKLKKEIETVRQQLDDGALNQIVVEEVRVQALTDNIFYGDDESAERLNGFQWCEDGCPVVIRGDPELYFPQT